MNDARGSHRLMTLSAMLIRFPTIVLTVVACSHEPSPALVEARANVTMAESAVHRAEETVAQVEARLVQPRAALNQAERAYQAEQQRCDAAQAEHAAQQRALPPGSGLCLYVPAGSPRQQVEACNRFHAVIQRKIQVCNHATRARGARDRAAGPVRQVERELQQAQNHLSRTREALDQARERLSAVEAAEE